MPASVPSPIARIGSARKQTEAGLRFVMQIISAGNYTDLSLVEIQVAARVPDCSPGISERLALSMAPLEGCMRAKAGAVGRAAVH